MKIEITHPDFEIIFTALVHREWESCNPTVEMLHRNTRERLVEAKKKYELDSAMKDRDPDTGGHDPVEDHIPYP